MCNSTCQPRRCLCDLQEVPELAALLSTATDAGPPKRAAAAASAQAAAAAEAKQQRAPPSGLPGLSANRDTRAARIFKAEERTEEDELVRATRALSCTRPYFAMHGVEHALTREQRRKATIYVGPSRRWTKALPGAGLKP